MQDQATKVLKRVDALEQDEDVQRVFPNLGSTNTPVSL
jgi:transcriptional/translational regulatory protein YebC/TACO1